MNEQLINVACMSYLTTVVNPHFVLQLQNYPNSWLVNCTKVRCYVQASTQSSGFVNIYINNDNNQHPYNILISEMVCGWVVCKYP